MNLDKHEMKLLLTAALIQLCIPGQPIKVAWLTGVFSRPGKLQDTIKKLRMSQLITFDPFAQVLRVLPHPGLNILFEFQDTPELFTNERPLDAVLAEVSGVRCQVSGGIESPCKKPPERVILHTGNFAPVPPKPPDPPPDPGPENPSRIAFKTEIITDVTATEITAESPAKTAPAVASASRVNRLTDSSVMAEREKNLNPGITDEARDNRVRARMISGQCTEAELISELVELLAGDPKNPHEMKENGGHWRVDWVRPHPKLLARLLIQLRELIAAGWVFKTNRAAWLESSLKNELRRMDKVR